MLTHNTFTDIDLGEWFSLPLSMVPEPLQEHVIQAKSQRIGHNHVPTPCGFTNDHLGAEAPCYHLYFLYFPLFIPSKTTIGLPRPHPDALHGTAVSLSHVLIMRRVKSGAKGGLLGDVILMSVFLNRRASTRV